MQRRNSRLVSGSMLFAGLLAALVAAESASAFPTYRTNFFAAYPEAVGTRLDNLPSRAGHCGVCHFSFSGGGPRNLFGQAVEATPSRSVSDILGLGGLDSDGDGFTNEEEIIDTGDYSNTPTFPGLTAADVGSVSAIDTADLDGFYTPMLPVPTVGEWGLFALALLLMTAATIIMMQSKPVAVRA